MWYGVLTAKQRKSWSKTKEKCGVPTTGCGKQLGDRRYARRRRLSADGSTNARPS